MIAINLIRPAPAPSSRISTASAVALGLLLGVAALHGWQARELSSLERLVESLEASLASGKEADLALGEERRVREVARRAVVTRWRQSRGQARAQLVEIARSMSEGVTLTELTLASTGFSLGGFADTPSSAAAFVERLEASGSLGPMRLQQVKRESVVPSTGFAFAAAAPGTEPPASSPKAGRDRAAAS